MLFANVTMPIRQLHMIYDNLNDALIYAEGFFDILNNKKDIEQSGHHRPAKVEGNFEISGVDFTYPNGTKALTNINMNIQSGKITAFVGLSGAGKSTIVNLLDKFYEPQTGTIKLDGIDIRDWDTQYLRENIGLVLQKNHIFDGSIEENIRYGKPDATFEEVEDAAKKAYIYDMIVKMPDGFKTNANEDLSSWKRYSRTAAAHCHCPYVSQKSADNILRRTHGKSRRCGHRANQKRHRCH